MQNQYPGYTPPSAGTPQPGTTGNPAAGTSGGLLTVPPNVGGPSGTYTGGPGAINGYGDTSTSGFTYGAGPGAGSAYGGSNWGAQPAGNNYPTGIYGVGPKGSGTAVGTVTEGDLTSNWLNKLTNDPNNQYLNIARQNAVQQANSRGLVNSSIAAGNAQRAAIEAALPIAQANAQANLGLQTTNLDNLARIGQSNIAAKSQVQSANISAGAQENVARQNNAGALLRQTDMLGYEGQQADLNYQRQLGLQDNQGMINASNQNQQNLWNTGQMLMHDNNQLAYGLAVNGMNNPGFISNPQAMTGYFNTWAGYGDNYLDAIFSQLFGQTGG